MEKMSGASIIKVLPYAITVITSILLLIKYLREISSYNWIAHLHVWFGLFFLILITQKMGNSRKKSGN